jgi:hypothetical protein
MLVYGFAGLWSPKEMTSAIAVQGAKQALPLDHLTQGRHDRARRFLLD